jgi:hypothetical protein
MLILATLGGVIAPAVLAGPIAASRPEPHEIWTSHTFGLDALLIGRLYGDARSHCAWLGSQRSGDLILWPDRYHVAFTPLRILDRRGRVVARGGDWIKTGGGDGSTRRQSACRRAVGVWVPSSIEFWGVKPPK